MTVARPTPEQLFAEIEKLTQQDRDAPASADSAEHWTAVAERAERKRDLWRQLARAAGGETPEWARYAAFRTGDHYADQAAEYRRYVSQTEALLKQADA